MKKYLVGLMLISMQHFSFSQMGINMDGGAPHSSAMLDVRSVTKGFLIPRMTAEQKNAVVNPATGLFIYQISDTVSERGLWIYDGLKWVRFAKYGEFQYWVADPLGIHYNGVNVGIGTNSDINTGLSILMPAGSSTPLRLRSADTWQTALILSNTSANPLINTVTFSVGGTGNYAIWPGNFGIYNNKLSNWIMNTDNSKNFVAFGNDIEAAELPKSRVHVYNGDVNIDKIGRGIILKSPNGNCWRITIDDGGNLIRTQIPCPGSPDAPPESTTITLQPGPDNGNDCYTSYLASDPTWADGNANRVAEISVVTWTNGGALSKTQGYVSFNIDGIPPGAHITSADLYIYGLSSSVDAPQGNYGDNRLYIQRILSSWNENTITWNNAPASTSVNQVITPATTTTWNADIHASVTSMVQDMIDSNQRYGFALKLVNDVVYSSIVLGSSEVADPAKRPKLVVTYTQ